MGSFSDYTENAVLDALLGGVPLVLSGTNYMALFTAAPSDAGGGTEVTGGGYVRQAIVQNQTNFPAAVGGAISNGTPITFITATGAWGTITHFALFDAATAGNMIMWGALTAAKTVGAGDTFNVAISDLDVTLD